MADDESQVEEETSWWASEGFGDSDLPSMSIDEPLEWPDSLPWEEFSAAAAPPDAQSAPPAEPADLIFPVDEPAAPAEPDREWQAGSYDPDATMAAPTPLGGLGGSAPAPAPGPVASEPVPVQPLPESIWSFDGVAERDDQVAGLATLAAPLVHADGDGRGRARWPRRLDVRRGNVAVVALISAVSLVLLGMFLSVRSRNDLPTDATASPPRTDQIATANTRNPQPPTSLATTTTVAGAINIAELVPPADAAAADTGGGAGGGSGGSGGGGGGGITGRTAVATTAPARSNVAPAGSGGGGSAAATEPAPQSTATTAAPDPPPSDTTSPTAPPPPPPVDDTTDTTRPRTSTPTFTMPSIPDVTVPNSGSPTPDFPSFPTITRNDS